MLRSLKNVIGYKLAATDGLIGDVHDFYFEDDDWMVRYLVADTGDWLPGRKVLLPKEPVGIPDARTRTIPIELTRKKIEDAPGIEMDKPVSRQWEIDFFTYFGWAPYWTTGTMQTPVAAIPKAREKEEPAPAAEQGDPHLRSEREVTGYHIAAIDGEIGHVDDFICEDETWIIRYLVVDTRNWLPGRRVLVSPQWLSDISWEEHKVFVNLHRESIQNSPEFDPSEPINREYEMRLYDYYGQPKYW